MPGPVRQITLLVLAAMFALGGAAAEAKAQTLEQAVELDPAARWHVLETVHFRIAYQGEDQSLARQTARTAEEVYASLKQLHGFEPATPVRIVVAGSYDVSNGYAIPFPYPQVQLFLEPPRPGTVLADTGGNWLRLLLSHELTHTFHLDQVRGIPKVLRWIFGRAPGLGTWQTWSPIWLIEGIGTANESRLTGTGRIGGALPEAILRQAALSGKFPRIDQATAFDNEYPGGNVPYLFGGHFVSWLVEKYGQDKLNAYIEDYAAMPVPFAVDWSAYRTFGESFSSLWEKWQEDVTTRAKAQADAVRAQGLKMGTLLVEGQGLLNRPAFLPDGWAHYWHAHPDRIRRHWRVKPGARPEQVSLNTPAGELVLASDGRIFGARRSGDSFSLSNTVVEITWPELERSTLIRSAREPAVSADASTMVFVRRNGIHTFLMTLDLRTEGAGPERLTDPGEGVDYADPIWLDDDTILVSIFEGSGPDARRRLWRLSAGTGERIAPLLPESWGGHEIQPTLSPDGRRVVFASDRSGIYDLYVHDLNSGETVQLTRVLGAALEPTFTPDGDAVLYISWEAEGRALRTIEVPPAAEPQSIPAAAAPDPRHEPLADKPARFKPQAEPETEPQGPETYNPLPTLVPRFWMPAYVQASNDNLLGAWTANEDLLRHWFYSLSVYYGLDSEEPRVFTTLGYSRLKIPALLNPLVFGSFSRNLSSFGTASIGTSKNSIRSVDVFELRESGRIGLASGSPLSIGLVPIDRDLDLGLSYQVGFEYERRSALDDSLILLAAQAGADPRPFTGRSLSGFFTRLSLSEIKRSGGAISPEFGIQMILESDLYHEVLGGDYSTAIFSGDVRGYLPVPFLDHHVLALRVSGGTTQGDRPLTRAFVLGGSLGQGLITLSGSRLALLRGYGESAFAGDHVASANAEYRLPLLRPRRGAWNLPIYLKTIHLAGFVDAGTAWDEGNDPMSDEIAVGVGAELVFDVILSYYLPTPVRVGVGRGLRVSEQTEFYVRLGRSF